MVLNKYMGYTDDFKIRTLVWKRIKQAKKKLVIKAGMNILSDGAVIIKSSLDYNQLRLSMFSYSYSSV